MSGPEPAAGGPATAGQARVFEDEVRDAVRYERGLAVKCVAAILLVAVILALRVYFFG
ncbi:MAG TPA: hypothetical protein VIF35_21365 [Streptosporangiaceae bacterium]